MVRCNKGHQLVENLAKAHENSPPHPALPVRCFSPLRIPGVSTIEIPFNTWQEKGYKDHYSSFHRNWEYDLKSPLSYLWISARALEPVEEGVSEFAQWSELLLRVHLDLFQRVKQSLTVVQNVVSGLLTTRALPGTTPSESACMTAMNLVCKRACLIITGLMWHKAYQLDE